MEVLVAGALFAAAMAGFLRFVPASGAPSRWPAGVLLATLVAAYLGLSIGPLRLRLALWLSSRAAGVLVPPSLLLVACVLYVLAAHLPVARTIAIYTAWLFVPVVVLAGNSAARQLAAAALLWLPLEFRLVPALPLPASPGGYDASHLVGLVNGLWLFLVTRPLAGVGFTFRWRRSDAGRAIAAFAVYAVVALPAGLATSFLAWHPRVTAASLIGTPWLIYLGTAIPEEFLFRGVIQNACARAVGPAPALAIASVIFGLAHLPDPRYAALAAIAGVAYGWVYWKTGKITASAITHAGVDWVWVVMLKR